MPSLMYLGGVSLGYWGLREFEGGISWIECPRRRILFSLIEDLQVERSIRKGNEVIM